MIDVKRAFRITTAYIKNVILFDQDKNLVDLESEVVSVEGVNGPTLKVGSMEEVNTNGNWPKNYSEQ